MSQTNPKKRKMGLPSGAESGGAGGPPAGGGMAGPSPADAARNGLVIVNKLDYELKPDLSVCVSRANKIHHFSQTQYTAGQRMICVINSGADYIRPDRSYLEFTIQNTTTTAEMFLGQGSATNFIKDIIITSRSGDECERILDVNKLSSFLVKACSSKEQVSTTGSLTGFSTKSTHLVKPHENVHAHLGSIDNTHKVRNKPRIDRMSNHGASETVSIKPTEKVKFIIPLSMLSGIFKHDRLLPSMFMSGLRFDMLLETENKAAMTSSLTETGDPNTEGAKWTLIRPRIVCDSYQLTDSVQRVLNEEAATRGLELVFPSWHTTQFNITGQDNTLQMRKAVSRALSILTLTYPPENVVNYQNRDYFATNAWDITETQLRIGSLYFPQQSIRGDSGYETAKTCYYHMLRAASRLGCNNKPSSITFDQFAGPQLWSGTAHLPMPGNWQSTIPVVNTTITSHQVEDVNTWAPATKADTDVIVPLNGMWWDLERSNVTELTGIPINNSRVAEISFKLQDYTNNKVARDCFVYLCYVRLIRVFLQNVEVEE